ncbi:hypothetical protein G4B88_020122 [Cannabis sativa]|uniref:Casparian strip membrane protein domain-containing protein n=1 Tax=Cannabis sativa TaxID=3483 RepID=A0A7J6E5N7_CANSA|nr:hypothetical protein G4B88_020122 [Cannabis sativa]
MAITFFLAQPCSSSSSLYSFSHSHFSLIRKPHSLTINPTLEPFHLPNHKPEFRSHRPPLNDATKGEPFTPYYLSPTPIQKKALVFVVIVNAIVSAYSLIQALRCVVSMDKGSVLFSKPLVWVIFSGDQSIRKLQVDNANLNKKVCFLSEELDRRSIDNREYESKLLDMLMASNGRSVDLSGSNGLNISNENSAVGVGDILVEFSDICKTDLNVLPRSTMEEGQTFGIEKSLTTSGKRKKSGSALVPPLLGLLSFSFLCDPLSTRHSSGIEEMNQTPFPSSRQLFFSKYYLLWSISLFVYLYALFFCLSTPPTPPSSTTSTVFSFSLSTMASSSRNPNPITALDDEDSLVDEFDHISIPSPSSPHKKNPFEISNSIPFEEFFPRIRTRTDDQDLQQAIDQFLHVESPTSTPVSLTTQVPASCTQPSLFISTLPMPHSSPLPTPQTQQTSVPPPIMTDSVTTHAAKGKAIALSPTSHPSHFRESKRVVINEPCLTISIAISPATRATFTREHSQVEDSVRNQSNSKATPIFQHIQGLQTIGFQEDSPALYVDAAFDKKNALTGTSFIFKIGCQHPVASHFFLLPRASSPLFAKGEAMLQNDHHLPSPILLQKHTPDVLTDDVADIAVGLILGVLRRLCDVDRSQVSGPGPRPGSGSGSTSWVRVPCTGYRVPRPGSESRSGSRSEVQVRGTGASSGLGSGVRIWVQDPGSRVRGPGLGPGSGPGFEFGVRDSGLGPGLGPGPGYQV